MSIVLYFFFGGGLEGFKLFELIIRFDRIRNSLNILRFWVVVLIILASVFVQEVMGYVFI